MKFKLYLFSVLTLVVIFADEIFYSYMAFNGISVESGMKAKMAIGIAGVCYFLLFVDVIKNRLSLRNYKQLIVLAILLFLYVITGEFYSPQNDNYKAYLLTYGAYCIPAAYIGMSFANNFDLSYINKLLPFFIIPLTFIIGSTMGSTIAENAMLKDDESGLNYQSVSYFMSYFYAYSVYYCFFSGVSRKGLYGKLIFCCMMLTMFANALFCLFGGGRGAFVYIVFITIFLIWKLYESYKNYRGHITLILIAVAILFLLLSDKLGLWDSAGVLRVVEHLTDDDSRRDLWKVALDYFLQSPIFGWGVGSIWWTVGFYSHNFITDLLAETGIIGTIIVVKILFTIFIRLYKRFKIDKSIIFILLVFLGTMVSVTFSGYWIASHNLFFAFGFVYAYNYNDFVNLNCITLNHKSSR